MSSRPNSSRNHQKSMYSSLPSASKIYVSTTKSKQKNIHSAKRKRKKSEQVNSVVESISDETLISLTSPITSSSQIGLKDSPRNVKNKVSKTLSKEEWVEKFVQLDESDSDSYIHDDKVKVVNTYFDVCIESDEFNDDHGITYHEPEEFSKLSSDDVTINDPICGTSIDETAQTNTFGLSVIKSDKELISNNLTDGDGSLSNHSVVKELSKSVENIVFEMHQSDSTMKNETVIKNELFDSECLINDTVKDFGQTTISKELSSFTLNNNCIDDDNFNVSRGSMTDDVLETNRSQIDSNISQTSGCKNNNSVYCNDLKNETERVLSVESDQGNLHTVKKEAIDKLDEKTDNPCFPEVCQFKSKSNINETMPSQGYLGTDETVTSRGNLDTDETTHSNYCLNIDESTVSKDCLEQDSCTESELIDVNNLSDHCNDLNVEANRELNINFLESNTKTRIELFPLKRSISLPESLQALRKIEHFHTNVGSIITLSSDKATITSDLFTLDNDKQLKCLDKEHKFRDSDCNTVASGEDVPIVDILPTLTMLKAKMRSYVFGCKGLDGALLGSEELSRFFPNNKVAVFVGTWNMNGHDPPRNIDDFLLPHDSETLPDIYAIGIQESMQSKSEWELMLQTTLGPSHVLFASTSLGVLHLAIFLRRDLIWFCSEPEDANVATRVGSMVKTKGAVAICFMLFGTSFLFVNSHLTAHEQNLVDRISDYEKICSGLDLPKNIPSKISPQNKNVTSRFDCVFWCGDLNFRIMWNRPAVLRFMKERDHSNNESCSMLLKHDQLQKAIREGAAFHGFQEGFINFDPSFKFDIGTNAFDSTKLRVPSYTDRILYRFKESSCISCLHYNSVPEMVTSDHKPVYGIFNVSLKPGRDDVPLAAGIFKRDVYLEALKRRANFLEVSRNHKQSAVCSMM